ncbi:MAG: four helix bundle protein [Tannerella sp.]|jgi:four helix bundle protein|nr:four helix bundle protein [Tannerella sp.]
MAKYNILQEKSFAFAVRAVNLYKHLAEQKKEFILSKQILRSGTSIGANVEEGIGAQSDRDFMAKMSVSYKEARETIYWLRLLAATDYITKDEETSMLNDAEEICKILAKIILATKQKLTPPPSFNY